MVCSLQVGEAQGIATERVQVSTSEILRNRARKITEGQRERQDNSMAAWAPAGKGPTQPLLWEATLTLGLSCLEELRVKGLELKRITL